MEKMIHAATIEDAAKLHRQREEEIEANGKREREEVMAWVSRWIGEDNRNVA